MMWMMGYNDAGDFNTNIQDPFTGRKLRPLMPRPATAAGGGTTNPPCLNHHFGKYIIFSLSAMVEQNKRELNTQQVVVSSRWNPTPEQLQTLEELYRRGTRTPSAEQIQQITSQLRRYGKIEGKNVFYWFQNHKARERQKRRRQLETLSDEQQQPSNNNNNNNNNNRAENGANRTVFEVEQTKNWAISPTNSSTIAEKTTQGATKGADAECKTDGWVQFDDATAEILQQQQRRNATWQMMNLSCSPSPTNLIINSSNNSVTSTSIPSSSTVVTTLMETNRTHDFINIFSEPYNINSQDHSGAHRETLQLFPLERRRGDEECAEEEEEEEEEESGADMSTANGVATSTFQFFEFLPLKN
ncbi:hypothetical protein DH2020_038615 [Rehmannia glutinosa]|uniref:Homeobox domain-containing protein n=1 Tax=Rehmannia glutinosa TaxID=99300 RepID=A0ABR0UZ95_REHGL